MTEHENGERRKDQQELLATAKAMTDATTMLTSQLKQIGNEISTAAEDAMDRSQEVVRQARVVKMFTLVTVVLLMTLLIFSISNRQLQRDNRAVLNRINVCLNAISKCATDPPK